MPKAPRKRERLVQVFNWLQYEYPLDGVKLTLTRRANKETLENFGWVETSGRDRLVLFLNMRGSLSELLETLLHEYAHCMSWAVDGTRHSPGWGITFARLYSRFTELDGYKDSYEFPWVL